jgi:tRNA (cmo5U34)-methyltransferase
MRDEIFKVAKPVCEFVFDSSVAEVFDDMLERSVPFYHELQRMVVELAEHFLAQKGTFYDIGCSTGNTIATLAQALGPSGRAVQFVGVEPAAAMREKARAKFASLPEPDRFSIISSECEDIDVLPDARVITILYTLQFLRPMKRLKVLEMCHRSLAPQSCLILAEKIITVHREVRHLFIDQYHQFKERSGYSKLEIARKREALESILVPFTSAENITLLKDAGFAVVEPILQWYNFAAYLAVKL